MMLKKIGYVVVVGLVVLATTSMVHAGVSGPAYPAPGGNNWSGTGISPGHSGGITWSYSTFDDSAYDKLWWGLSSKNAAKASFTDTNWGTNEIFGAGTIESDHSAQWTGSAQLYVYNSSNPITYNTRMTITLTGDAAFEYADPTLFTNTDFPNVIAKITGNFSANIIMQAYAGGTTGWISMIELFDRLHTNPSHRVCTDFSTGFFSTDAVNPIPAPGALLLCGLGTGLMGWIRRGQY